ncbi:MAG: asparagine synthase C-terminal domain-containing protein [Gammaproteobacteria bacterium]|nr:asparagine synthase C-terminal domain-containing protein [Gammaproteobacteria bacterium]
MLSAVEPMLNHGRAFRGQLALPTALGESVTREHVTVASAVTGDELFGGYWRYLGHHYLDRYRRLPAIVRKGPIEPFSRLLPSARSTRRLDRPRQMRQAARGDLPARSIGIWPGPALSTSDWPPICWGQARPLPPLPS